MNIEPYRIKAVEPIRFTTREERERALERAGFNFFLFRDVVRDLTGYKHIIPTHQGRAAERILFHSALRPGDIVLNNIHFDTTRANIEVEKAEARDLVVPEGWQPATIHPFKGNMD